MIDGVQALVDAYEENIALRKMEKTALILMARITSMKINPEKFLAAIREAERQKFIELVAPALCNRKKLVRQNAYIITFHLLGIDNHLISDFTGYALDSVRHLTGYYSKGNFRRLGFVSKKVPKHEQPELRDAIFALLHEPPRSHNINRTTWTIDLLHDVLAEQGVLIGKNAISRIIQSEGYVFRKTREVLTSNDPEYREKLTAITNTLQHLGRGDMFFSIDEYGPVSVRERGGRRRVRKGEKPTVPQYQDSKGHIILVAALELKTNQISYFYTDRKDTRAMINLTLWLIEKYRDCRRLYLSWDAASWHSSRKYLAEINHVNSREFREVQGSPSVILRPLPARAQFLNVIESVFSGLSRSVISNSNYASVDEMKAAIDIYISERNLHFRKNPRRAGNKIWGREQVPSYFSVSHNCKDPRFMRLGGA